MKMSEIIESLDADITWMVAFNLQPLRKLASDDMVKELMFLDPGSELDEWSHVCLSSNGRFLAPKSDGCMIDGVTAKPHVPPENNNLLQKFKKECDAFNPDTADSFALAQLPESDPVLLHVSIENGVGTAKALFSEVPDQSDYELLSSVGVDCLGFEDHTLGKVATFQNQISDHIRVGMLSHFRRTDACNRFFFEHGKIDDGLRAGLLKASNHRISWIAGKLANQLELVGMAALNSPHAMSWLPPAGDQTFDFGTVVPLAFLRGGLAAQGDSSLVPVLDNWLSAMKINGLWPFQDGDLETSTDSSLVLASINDAQAVPLLDRFLAADGGYLPQITTTEKQDGTMKADNAKRHWCQSDYATTCAIRAQQAAGSGDLDDRTTRFIHDGFENRSGLYFANPYMVDWFAALALRDDADLKGKLLNEILASVDPHGQFGTFDPVTSTACAILALDALGYQGRVIRAAQLRLTKLITSNGLPPEEIPFYSSLVLEDGANTLDIEGLQFNLATDPNPRVVTIDGVSVAISFHSDQHKMAVGGLALRALNVVRAETEDDSQTWRTPEHDLHPRYSCIDRTAYIADFALPPYIQAMPKNLFDA